MRVLAVAAVVGCSTTRAPGPATDERAPIALAADDAVASPPRHRFSIVFDYRFDGGYFSQHTERRATLEAAAAIWADILASDFPSVQARAEPRLLTVDDGSSYRGEVDHTVSGRACQRWTRQAPHRHDRTPDEYPEAGLGDHASCRNPDHEPGGPWCYTVDPAVRWEHCDTGATATRSADGVADIGDLVVFVYAEPTGSTKASARPILTPADGPDRDALAARVERLPFQPWAGVITVNSEPERPWFFDQTPETHDDIPSATHYDFLMTATHELGHVLGFSTGSPFDTLVTDGHFVGARAVAAAGGPVPLAPGSSHLRQGFAGALPRPHLEDLLMTPSATIAGYRVFPSAIEAAMLADLGYELDASGLDRYDPGGRTGGSPYRDASADPRDLPAGWRVDGAEPIAAWWFDDPAHLHGAVRGRPVLYGGATGDIRSAAVDGGVRLRDGARLYAEHPAEAGNCGGAELDCYTVVLDVRRPSVDDSNAAVPLVNTNIDNANPAELSLAADGRLGDGGAWSPPSVVRDRWHRVAYVVDLSVRTQTVFVDGREVLRARASQLDGRHSIEVEPPRLVLFGSSNAAAGAVDVARAVLYDRALTPDAVAALGRP